MHDSPPAPSSVDRPPDRAVEVSARPGVFRTEWVNTENLITLALVVFATGFVFVNLRPGLWIDNTTPTGGDMGAHVWAPAYLRDTLLPQFRLTGWSPDWYAGFPAFTFYMIVPSLLIVIVNVGLPAPVAVVGSAVVAALALAVNARWGTTTARTVSIYGVGALVWMLLVPVPYGIAMKLVVVAGLMTLPVAAWAAGRLGGLAFPGPAVLAVMTLPFLFDRGYNIYGGNLMSTMAGEFAYSLALAIAVVYLGVATRGMETGRHRGLAASLLALAGLTHLFAAFFALVFTFALLVTRPGRREAWWLAFVGPLSALLAAFWVLPFFANRALLNDMGWGKERRYVAGLWDRSDGFGDQTFLVNDPPLQLFVILAIVGALISGLRRIRFGMALAITAAIFAMAFVLLPEGRLWNVRLLPFYYLSIFLLAGITIAEMGRMLAGAARAISDQRRALITAIPAAIATLALFVSLGMPLRSLPFGGLNDQGQYSWLGFTTAELNLGPSWLNHNFTGYEGQAAYGEYSLMIATMDQVGEQHGCGRALWEYESARLGSYGTPMSPMLLPHWTSGCIGSMEGLYFEASATTPYHFLLQSELSSKPSRAQRDLPYSPLAVDRGTAHLQELGVRYYMAFSDDAVTSAQQQPGLTELATSGPWVVFLVDQSDLVVSLDHLPVVVDGADAGGEDWLVPTVAQWEAADVPLIAGSGPADWPRTSPGELRDLVPAYGAAVEEDLGRVEEMRALAEAFPSVLERVDSDIVSITNVQADESTIQFSVDQIGTPVLVRTSYFPNWKATGAEGPYRVSPNAMVVVPTDTDVKLSYGRSAIEWVSLLLTAAGIVLLVMLGRFRERDDTDTWWDWTRSVTEELPDRELVLSGLRDSSLDPEVLEMASAGIGADLSATVRSFGLASATLALSAAAWLLVRPAASAPWTSLVVILPGVAAVAWLVFAVIPRLVENRRYESGVLVPARLLVDYTSVGDVHE